MRRWLAKYILEEAAIHHIVYTFLNVQKKRRGRENMKVVIKRPKNVSELMEEWTRIDIN